MDLDLRRAGLADVEAVGDVLAEASGWLRSRGLEQWPDRFPADALVAAVERGELYLASSGGDVVATVTLQWSDPSFWGDRGDAGFVHRLAVRRSHAGLGSAIIARADREAAQCGRAYLCLDCLSDNVRLRRYYEDLGFRPVGEVTGPPTAEPDRAPWRVTLHERRVGRWAR